MGGGESRGVTCPHPFASTGTWSVQSPCTFIIFHRECALCRHLSDAYSLLSSLSLFLSSEFT